MMHYYVIATGASTGIQEFDDKVQKLLNEGWECQGGISFGTEGLDKYNETCWILAQALVKHDFKKPPSDDAETTGSNAQ